METSHSGQSAVSNRGQAHVRTACLPHALTGICPSDSAGLLSRLLHAALQSGTPHSTASAQNGGDFPAEQGSTLHSQNSGADDIAPKTRSREKDASLDGSAMERTAAASQNSTLAAALAEANAQSSEASQAHVTAGGRFQGCMFYCSAQPA